MARLFRRQRCRFSRAAPRANPALVTDPSPPAPRLAALFSDHVVLQQGRPIPVWGWDAPGQRLTARLLAAGADHVVHSMAELRDLILGPGPVTPSPRSAPVYSR